MLGERSDQRGLWEADRLYLDHVGRESFYGLLASMRGRLFRDADFAEFYCPDNGRDSVPPSLLATALLLQSHDKVSDAEAKARADFDLRWKVALGIEAEDRPFAKSTLQVFRAQLITAVEVLPGNAPDNLGALELVEASEANTGVPVAEAMGDAAYGDGDTRQTFADAGRTLIARVPGRPNRTHFPKEDFHIDLEAGTCTCPAGNVTRTMAPAGRRTGQTGRTYRLQAFRFDAAVCGVCPLRSQCVAAKPGTGRTVQLHPQEALLQQARALQQSEAFAEYRQRRVVVEHRLARLVQLGIRQSRYFGRAKTRFQLYLAATVANLTLVAAKAGLTGETGSGPSDGSAQVAGMVNSATAWLGQIWTLSLLVSALLTKSLFPIKGFPSGFLGALNRRLS